MMNENGGLVIRRSISLMVAMLVVGALVTGCVDGTTPDCSDAGSNCGPDFTSYPDSGDGPPVDTGVQETGADTGAQDTGAQDTGAETSTDAGRG
jgi:hypothetical protein